VAASFIEPGRWKPPGKLSLQGVSATSSRQTNADPHFAVHAILSEH